MGLHVRYGGSEPAPVPLRGIAWKRGPERARSGSNENSVGNIAGNVPSR